MSGSRIPVGYPGDCDSEEPITEANFKEGSSLAEGISGRRTLDTTYENDGVDSLVNNPRSNYDKNPEDDKDKPWRDWK